MVTRCHVSRINQIGDYQSDFNRPRITQKIKNYFSGGRIDRVRARFMRSIGRPLSLSSAKVGWRIKNERSLANYIMKGWTLNDFLQENWIRDQYKGDQYYLNLKRCKLDNVSLANANVASGSIENSEIRGLDVSHSKLGGFRREGEGFNVSGAKGSVKLKYSDLSGWQFNKKTEISNKAEINEACANFLKDDITPLLGIITSINSINDRRDNIPHKTKLMNHLASAFHEHYGLISNATPLQLGARIFLGEILSSNRVYHESKKYIDCKSTLNDKECDAILDLYKYGESQENQKLKTHIRKLAYNSTFSKLLEGSPKYFNTLVSNVNTIQEMNELALDILQKIDNGNLSFRKIQKLNSNQKDALGFLKLKCGHFKEEAKKEVNRYGNRYVIINLERLGDSIPLDIQKINTLRFLQSQCGHFKKEVEKQGNRDAVY